MANTIKGKPYYKTSSEVAQALQGEKVKVYFNLHQHVFSIVAKGLVVGYADELALTDGYTRVSEKGRQRVIKEKRKNVHAYVHGIVSMPHNKPLETSLYYNPYEVPQFVEYETREPVGRLEAVQLKGKRIMATLAK